MISGSWCWGVGSGRRQTSGAGRRNTILYKPGIRNPPPKKMSKLPPTGPSNHFMKGNSPSMGQHGDVKNPPLRKRSWTPGRSVLPTGSREITEICDSKAGAPCPLLLTWQKPSYHRKLRENTGQVPSYQAFPHMRQPDSAPCSPGAAETTPPALRGSVACCWPPDQCRNGVWTTAPPELRFNSYLVGSLLPPQKPPEHELGGPHLKVILNAFEGNHYETVHVRFKLCVCAKP